MSAQEYKAPESVGRLEKRALVVGVLGLVVSIVGWITKPEDFFRSYLVAFLLVLVFTPPGYLWQAFAFLLFRLFDILKPPPIRFFDRKLKSGFGVMFDDLLAAFYALLILAIARMFFAE